MNKVIIKKADSNDIDALTKLFVATADYHGALDAYYKNGKEVELQSRSFITKRLNSETFLLLIAYVEVKPAGMLIVKVRKGSPASKAKKIGFVLKAYVDEEFRGSGVATKLFEVAKKWWKEQGITGVELVVSSKNKKGINFWEKLGFGEIRKTMKLELE